MKCGTAVGHDTVCPKCGADLKLQRKAVLISNAYYNRGLDKAQIRDLSGAVDMLERSLKYNKRNITARNLLGLIYFETGEVVSALSEWIISKNLKASDNIASDYIERLQANPERLDAINQTIKRYNRALDACRDGNEDIAEMMLKKVLTANPHLIKGYHLLALIYMKSSEWEKARKVLVKAIPIDRTNDTTLRFLKEIEEQTGQETVEKERKFKFSSSGKKKKNVFFSAMENAFKNRKRTDEKLLVDDEVMDNPEDLVNRAQTVQPVAFRDTSAFSGLLYIILGIVMGILVVWFLVVPSVRQDVNRKANEQVAELNTVIAKQTAQMDELNAAIAGYGASADTAAEQLSQASEKSEAMERIVQAYNAYRGSNFDYAKTLLSGLNTEILSLDAQTMASNLFSDISTQLYSQYLSSGVAYYDQGDYQNAIVQLLKAYDLKDSEYDVLSYLANSYRMLKQKDNAITYFNRILEKFPDTQRAETAQYYINQINAGNYTDSEIASSAAAAAEAEAQAQASETEQSQSSQTQNDNESGQGTDSQTTGGQTDTQNQ